MANEVFVDGIGNISVQGPVVTLSFVRTRQVTGEDANSNEEVVNVTMTGQNLLKMSNILNNTIKRIASRANEAGKTAPTSDSKPAVTTSDKKSKTVNWKSPIICVRLKTKFATHIRLYYH